MKWVLGVGLLLCAVEVAAQSCPPVVATQLWLAWDFHASPAFPISGFVLNALDDTGQQQQYTVPLHPPEVCDGAPQWTADTACTLLPCPDPGIHMYYVSATWVAGGQSKPSNLAICTVSRDTCGGCVCHQWESDNPDTWIGPPIIPIPPPVPPPIEEVPTPPPPPTVIAA